MNVCDLKELSAMNEGIVKREIKEFLSYEICIRHERKNNPTFIDRLLEIKGEVDQIADKAGYGGEVFSVYELLISRIQFEEAWIEAIGLDDPEVSYLFDDLGKYLIFVDGVFEKYGVELANCVNNLPTLQQYKLAEFRGESNLENVLSWWLRVKKRNEGAKEKDWVVGAKMREAERKIDLDDGRDMVIKYQVSEDPFPELAPELLNVLIWKLVRMSIEERGAELEKLRASGEVKFNKYKMIIKCFDAWDRVEENSNLEPGEEQGEFVPGMDSLRKLYESLRNAEGVLVRPVQVERALVGLMCWDARERLGTGPLAIEEVKAKFLNAAQITEDDAMHERMEQWLEDISKKIKEGEF